MCDPISWIEKDKELFYLTDKDVFSKHGREVFGEKYKDNDLLGHNAIRLYWNLKGGTQHENTSLWEPDSYPAEIGELLKDIDTFKKNWGRMLSRGMFMSDDLRYIIEYGTSEYQDLAWNQLLKQEPSNNDLCYMIKYGTFKYQDLAWNQLLKQEPSNDDLCCIIKYSLSTKYKKLAWNQLLKQAPSNDELINTRGYCNSGYQHLAQIILNQRSVKR